MAYADPGDVQSRWRTLTSDEWDIADALLSDAGVMLDAEFPAEASTASADAVMAERFRIASVLMVKSALMRPDGVQSETTGPYSVTYANAAGALFTTSAIRALIRGRRLTATSVELE